MTKRWLCSRWLWLAVCVLVGSLLVTIPAVAEVRQVMQIADALSSGIKDGLSHSGSGGSAKASVRMSVSFLFGLVHIEDTQNPYLWTVVGSVITGGGSGFLVWLLVQAGLWVWRRRGVAKKHTPGAGQA